MDFLIYKSFFHHDKPKKCTLNSHEHIVHQINNRTEDILQNAIYGHMKKTVSLKK